MKVLSVILCHSCKQVCPEGKNITCEYFLCDSVHVNDFEKLHGAVTFS